MLISTQVLMPRPGLLQTQMLSIFTLEDQGVNMLMCAVIPVRDIKIFQHVRGLGLCFAACIYVK